VNKDFQSYFKNISGLAFFDWQFQMHSSW